MIKCQACGTQNIDSSQFCDECGDSLQKYKAPDVSSNSVEEEDSDIDVHRQEVPIFHSASETSIGDPLFNEEENEVKLEIAQGVDEEVSNDRDTSVHKLEEILPTNDVKGVHSKLIIERGQSIGTEFSLASEVSNIGRWDADNGVFPDVDLDAHDAEAKVSRKHARILNKNGQYMLEDLGSTNGTFINRGRRLIPGSPHVLNDGDEIIVGKTFLRFQVL